MTFGDVDDAGDVGDAVRYVQNPELTNDTLNELFARAWPDHVPGDYMPVLARSLAYVGAYRGSELIGWVNVATDGGEHAFLLDPTVDVAYRRRGIGTALVRQAVNAAAAHGCKWLHVDFEPELEGFYRNAGFRPTAAGLIRLSGVDQAPAPVVAASSVPSPFEKLRARGLLLQCMLGVVLVLVIARLVPGLIDKTPTDSGSFGLFYLGIGLVMAVRVRLARLNVEQLFGPVPTTNTLRLTVVAIPLGVLSIAGFWILFLPLSFAAPDFVRTWAIDGMSRMEAHSLSAWIARTIIAVIVAPVVEEILFRGLLLQRWALRWGTMTGVILSSAVFAIGHIELLGHFVFGVAMAALYLRTRSLWVPIAAHALNNFIVSVLTLPGELWPDKSPKEMTVASLQSGWWIGIVVLAVGLAMLEAYRRRYWDGVDLRELIRGPIPYTA